MIRSESRRCSGTKYRPVLKDDMRWARSIPSGDGAGVGAIGAIEAATAAAA